MNDQQLQQCFVLLCDALDRQTSMMSQIVKTLITGLEVMTATEPPAAFERADLLLDFPEAEPISDEHKEGKDWLLRVRQNFWVSGHWDDGYWRIMDTNFPILDSEVDYALPNPPIDLPEPLLIRARRLVEPYPSHPARDLIAHIEELTQLRLTGEITDAQLKKLAETFDKIRPYCGMPPIKRPAVKIDDPEGEE